MDNIERGQILLMLVAQHKGDVIEEIIACNGDREKEIKILEKYR